MINLNYRTYSQNYPDIVEPVVQKVPIRNILPDLDVKILPADKITFFPIEGYPLIRKKMDFLFNLEFQKNSEPEPKETYYQPPRAKLKKVIENSNTEQTQNTQSPQYNPRALEPFESKNEFDDMVCFDGCDPNQKFIIDSPEVTSEISEKSESLESFESKDEFENVVEDDMVCFDRCNPRQKFIIDSPEVSPEISKNALIVPINIFMSTTN